ncbi:MAG: hypothetical protein ACRERU_05345 [Methylococcales bacterium]
MAAVEGQQLAGRGVPGIEVGDAKDAFGVRFAGLGVEDLPLDLAGLAEVREIQTVVAGGGDADGALLDAAVGLIEIAMLKGERLSNRKPEEPRPVFADCP